MLHCLVACVHTVCVVLPPHTSTLPHTHSRGQHSVCTHLLPHRHRHIEAVFQSLLGCCLPPACS